MSFEELMLHASDIQFKATKHALGNEEQEAAYARNGVDGYYAQVPELFKPFSQMPDPAKYQPMIDDFKHAMRGLSNGENNDPINTKDAIYPANPTLTEMTTAKDYLVEWTGQAARQFKEKFLDPFPALARNQFILTAVLKSALEAHQAMWASARSDIDRVAHETMDAFDNGPCCNKNEWNVGFTVLSSVASVGSAVASVATAGATLPITLAAVAAATQVTAAAPPGGVEEKASGETALQITDAMKRAMDRITRDIGEVEAKISQALQSTSQLVAGNTSFFVAARPKLADMPRDGLTGDGGLGHSE